MNPYLKRLREQYEGLRSGIEGLQTRAAEENRDLTEDELRSVKEQGEQAKTLAKQIEDLTEIETRNAQVAEMAGKIANATGEQTRAAGGATTRDRDPGHYTKGGQHSFFGDLYRSKAMDDEDAARRLVEHNRALTTGGAGAGVVPPKWLIDEYAPLARQGRRLANAVRNIPLGDDPRPITLPKQTTGADTANPAEQAAENDATPSADKWASGVDTVVPKPTRGKQIVSRQMLDSASPAIDQLIYGDLLAAYDDQIEAKVGAALVAAAGAAAVTFASEATDWNTGTIVLNSVIDLQLAVRNARKRPADVLAMNVTRYGKFLKQRDPDGRPLIPNPGVGQAVNVAGVGSVAVDGIIEGLAVIATDGIPTAYPESYLAFRAADTILFEGNMMRFRYEERSGPESVELGIWAYTGVVVRYAGASVKRAQITAG
ncbi:phage major capsid protein [Micromonospora globbae]|uniref:Phage major capsid protein n=1 Tax=Micromonospora globbae TaxID=1894969 RepID=A0A420ETU9_9ACTN|nr:phage major capsid protein [Micromonospora globbae]RKF24136.1 phage major capsid protein [Micromonospora globbae]